MSIFIDCGDDVDGNYLFVVVFIIHANDFVMMLPDMLPDSIMCTSARSVMAQPRRVQSPHA